MKITITLLLSVLIVITGISSCKDHLTEKKRNEITDKIDPSAVGKHFKYIDISLVDKSEKGDFFSFLNFKCKIVIRKNCFANLKEGIAIQRIIFRDNIESLNISDIKYSPLHPFNINDTVIISGLLFSNEDAQNTNVYETYNCLFYIPIPKNSEAKNQAQFCNVISSIFERGLIKLKYSDYEMKCIKK